MSLIKKLFEFGKEREKSLTPHESIRSLKETEAMLQKKTARLEMKIEEETALARKNCTKNKRAALAALERKKRYEKKLQQIDGSLSTLEFQREALENAITNNEVLRVMGQAAKSLKSAQQNMDADQVGNLTDEIAEQKQLGDEILEAISNPIGFQSDIDEDDLLAELEELEQEELDEKLLSMGIVEPDTLPNAPTNPIPSEQIPRTAPETEHDALKELKLWAS